MNRSPPHISTEESGIHTCSSRSVSDDALVIPNNLEDEMDYADASSEEECEEKLHDEEFQDEQDDCSVRTLGSSIISTSSSKREKKSLEDLRRNPNLGDMSPMLMHTGSLDLPQNSSSRRYDMLRRYREDLLSSSMVSDHSSVGEDDIMESEGSRWQRLMREENLEMEDVDQDGDSGSDGNSVNREVRLMRAVEMEGTDSDDLEEVGDQTMLRELDEDRRRMLQRLQQMERRLRDMEQLPPPNLVADEHMQEVFPQNLHAPHAPDGPQQDEPLLPPPPPPNFPPVQDDFNQFLENDGEEIQGAEVAMEMRLAIVELLGLDGPLHVMFRNAALLAAYCVVFLLVLTYCPYRFGVAVVKLIYSKVTNNWVSVDQVQASDICRFLQDIEKLSDERHVIVYFNDFFYLIIGFMTISSVIFSADFFIFLMQRFVTMPLIHSMANQLRQLSLMVKIVALLLMRIFVLPMALGSIILILSANLVMTYDWDYWVTLLAVNSIGSYGLAWLAGITFMLSMTISILQLREVMHPDLFGKLIKPQEAHVELINSLVQESGFVHIKRMVTSLCVYIFLLCTLLLVPMLLFRHVLVHFNIISPSFFELRTWYFFPEIQLPMELIISHITFLSMLDKHKDSIGKMQHYWMVGICDMLGLTRHLMPLPIKSRKIINIEDLSSEEEKMIIKKNEVDPNIYRFCARPLNVPEMNPLGTHMKVIEEREVEVLKERASIKGEIESTEDGKIVVRVVEELVLGPPLVRPPEGWDARVQQNSSRWAWGTEAPSEIESNLAKRTRPSLHILRVGLLLTVSLVSLNSIAFFLAIVPLASGRHAIKLLGVPSFLTHDPICFVFGLWMWGSMGNMAYKLQIWRLFTNFSWLIRRSVYPKAFSAALRLVVRRLTSYYMLGVAIGIFSFANLDIGFDITYFADANVYSSIMDIQKLSSTTVTSHLRSFLSWSGVFQELLKVFNGFLVIELLTKLGISEQIGVRLFGWFGHIRMADWAINATIATNQLISFIVALPHAHLDREVFDEEFASKIDLVGDNVVYPTERLLMIIVIPLLMWSYLVTLLLEQRSFDVSLNLLSSIFAVSTIICAVTMLLRQLLMPIRRFFIALEKKIRDDNYLIGRKLVNRK